uniref:Ig-like domain-containing protein n=1 Tax=Hucho hucho TaxID=62062 RepID=A0A4W5RJ09_9TELE
MLNQTQHCFLTDPPKNTSASVRPSGSVAEGSSVTLTCSSNANPTVKNYTWYRVNECKMVPMESISQFLVLQDISESGLFCCEAQNSYGKEKSNIFVYLHHCPSTTTSQTSVPSIICGVVIALWILTVILTVYKYIR